jgi:hypothetical protein
MVLQADPIGHSPLAPQGTWTTQRPSTQNSFAAASHSPSMLHSGGTQAPPTPETSASSQINGSGHCPSLRQRGRHSIAAVSQYQNCAGEPQSESMVQGSSQTPSTHFNPAGHSLDAMQVVGS